MILLIAFALGFTFGFFRAKRRGGNRLDALQYGAAHGIAFLLVALVLDVVLGWMVTV